MPFPRLIYRVHAILRMFERNISKDDVRAVIYAGEEIQNYPDDKPFPSKLVLGWRGVRPIHVVYADNVVDAVSIIITVYEPDPAVWAPDFRRKRS